MATVESISTPINTVESIRKPFISTKPNIHIPTSKLTKTPSLTISSALYKAKQNSKPASKSKNNRTTTSSPNKAEIITKFKEELIEKDKLLSLKDLEIHRLKDQLQLQDKQIKDFEKELILMKENKQEENEYDEYAKKQMVRNVKLLSAENRQLHEEIVEYKNKEIKLMKLLFEMKKRGIPIEEMIETVDDLNSNTNINAELSNNSEASATFTPLILNTEDNFTVKPKMIPKLNFNQLNEKYNLEHLCFQAKQTNTQTSTSGTSNNTKMISSGTSNHSHSHDYLKNNNDHQHHNLNSNISNSNHPIKLNPNSLNIKSGIQRKKDKN